MVTYEDLLAYKDYIEDNLERIESGGWTPVCFGEFRPHLHPDYREGYLELLAERSGLKAKNRELLLLFSDLKAKSKALLADLEKRGISISEDKGGLKSLLAERSDLKAKKEKE